MALTKAKASNILLTTPAASSNDVTPATTEYVTTALANMVDSAPSTLNTLNELAAALGDDANFSTTVTNSIAGKLPLAGGTMTGHILLNNAVELRSKDTSSNIKTITRINSSNELEYGWSGSGPVKFMGGGAYTERMRIHTDGNVGIGDTSPSAIRLSVVTPTANNIGLQVENSNTADSFGMVVKGGNDANDYTADFRKRDNTSIMRILGSGNVGIGTGAPNGELEVNNTSSGGLGGRIVIRNGSSTSGSYCRLYLSPTANDPETRGTLIQAENVVGNNNMAMIFKV